MIANTATVKMFGLPRQRFSRLTQTTIAKTNTFFVAPGLDWVAGDELALFPTSMDHKSSDNGFIVSYDIATGQVELDRNLNYSHFGAPISTGSKYNGVDIRGEVILLTRNVKIVGNNTEAWGC
jgi:hypothetical protein